MAKAILEGYFAQADIRVNGARPWDIQVHNPAFYKKVLAEGSLGLGESYVGGWWDCQALDKFFYKLLVNEIDKKETRTGKAILAYLHAKITNKQSKKRAFEVGKKHYDLGNDLFKAMLDKRLTYTCGYWKNAKTLDEAQEAKLDLVCKKLRLKAGQRILDIGCGYGSFMKFAAEKYKVSCVGVTISKEQKELGEQLCEGLPIEFRQRDYRELNEPFDHVVSLGMFEHVGLKNYRAYMKVVHRCLREEGLFLLHTIGNTEVKHSTDPWIAKHIFPNGFIPCEKQILDAAEGVFMMEDWHNFGAYYDPTLMAWYNNVKKRWSVLSKKYNGRFKRMWFYYLLACAGAFRARRTQVWQIVFAKKSVPGGYISVR